MTLSCVKSKLASLSCVTAIDLEKFLVWCQHKSLWTVVHFIVMCQDKMTAPNTHLTVLCQDNGLRDGGTRRGRLGK